MAIEAAQASMVSAHGPIYIVSLWPHHYLGLNWHNYSHRYDMTFTDFLLSKLPEEEREELIQLLADRLSSLSPADKGFAIAQNTLNTQARIRKHGGLITEDQAIEKIHDELVQGVPKLQRFAAKIGDAALYRDLEKYRELPEIALAKHYSFNCFVQVEKERQQKEKEEQKQQEEQKKQEH
jgi:hypothetical protein